MSTWMRAGLACPACGGGVETPIAKGVHASRAPQTRAAILDGTLHRMQCTHCAAAIVIDAELLYTDFARGHWVQVGAAADLARWPTIERDALAGFQRWLTATSPAIAPEAARFTVRVVLGLDELRERLLLWDAGLDDALVECAKHVALRQQPAIRGAGHRLRVERVDHAELHLASIDDARQVRARWTMPRGLIDSLDRAQWRRDLPELFEPGFASIDRLLVDEAG